MRLSIALIPALAATLNAFAQCEPSASVRAVLDRNAALDNTLSMAEAKQTRTANLEQGLVRNPHDYFLLRRLMRLGEKKADEVAWAERMRAKYAGEPVYALLHAMALVGHDTPSAIATIEEMKAKDPPSRVYAELAGIFESGKQKDLARARRELDAFLKLCPAPLEAASISLAARVGDAARIAEVAGRVRRRLDAEDGVWTMSDVWEALWRMEFKAQPVTQHDAVRKQVAADLARLERSPRRQELPWITFLRDGYESAGNPEAVNRLSEEVLAKYPRSEEAKHILRDRWRKARPYPQNGSDTEVQSYRRDSLAKAREWMKIWPTDTLLRDQEFSALRTLDDTPPEDVIQCAVQLLTDYRKDPSWWGMPPVEFRVAAEFVKYKVHLADIPDLVEEAYVRAAGRNSDALVSDRMSDEIKAMVQRSLAYLRLERARVMIDYYAAVNKPERIPEIEADLAAIRFEKASEKASVAEVQGKAAEASGRKLDALLLYRSALAVRDSPPRPPVKDELPGKVDRLFRELGGTAATYSLLTDRTGKPTEAGASRWERPKNPIPSFAHSDLQGKMWKLTALEGRTVLINLWATWCGPCRLEHPDFQKLYERLKDRPDVSVISFNIDDDTGKVAPYMKENHYTFPVLLARETVDAVLDLVAIPQNWFLDAKGKLQWLQVGYGNEPHWQDMMIAKLEEVAKTR